MNLTLLMLILCILLLLKNRDYFNTNYITQNDYKVLKYDNSHFASERLDKIHRLNVELVDFMKREYKEGKGKILAERLSKRYRNNLQENYSDDPNNTSYTENKGDKIALCLREKITGGDRLHHQHLLEYVNLHELAHIASEGYGHENEFWSNFAFILKSAKAAGLHNPVNYNKYPVNYCGLDVEYNPYFDQNLE